MQALESQVVSSTIRPNELQRNGVDANSLEKMRPQSAHAIRATNMKPTFAEVMQMAQQEDKRWMRHSLASANFHIEDGYLCFEENAHLLDEAGVTKLSQQVGAPPAYIQTLPFPLQYSVLSHHLKTGRFVNRRMKVTNIDVFSREGCFRGFVRNDLCLPHREQVLEAVADGFGQDVAPFEIKSFQLDEDRLVLDMVTPHLNTEVRVGDVIQAGIHLEHSASGQHATLVSGLIHRLVCSNGMVQRECVRAKPTSRSVSRTRRLSMDSVDAMHRQMQQIRNMTASVIEGIHAKLDAIRQLQDEPVAVESVLEQLLRRARLHSRKLRERVLQAWREQENGEQHAYALMNALTWVASHPVPGDSVSSLQRQQLSRLAGIFAQRSVHLCPHCFSMLHA